MVQRLGFLVFTQAARVRLPVWEQLFYYYCFLVMGSLPLTFYRLRVMAIDTGNFIQTLHNLKPGSRIAFVSFKDRQNTRKNYFPASRKNFLQVKQM